MKRGCFAIAVLAAFAFAFEGFECAPDSHTREAVSARDNVNADSVAALQVENSVAMDAGEETVEDSTRFHASMHDEVREIIRPRCGSCHTSTLATSKPGALKVFDLAKAEWANRMSVRQLDSFSNRLKILPEADRKKVAQFVEEEKTKRQSM